MPAKASGRDKMQQPPESLVTDLAQLISLFPDIDRDYAKACLLNYAHDRVASVAEKLLDMNFSNYPRHNFGHSHIDKNAMLDQLNTLFPEHDVTELRQALSQQTCSNFYGAIDDLLFIENPRRRTRVKAIVRTRIGLDGGKIEPHQWFRSQEYQAAVYKRLRLEFAQHDSPSTIRAVLSENNYDYERTRAALSVLFMKRTLWTIFKSFFSSKAKIDSEKILRENPRTGCAELDAELDAIALRKRQTEEIAQVQGDHLLAREVNEQEYFEANEMMECGCCYGDYTWDDLVSCNGGHLVCRDCVTRTTQECAFGQADNAYDPSGLRCIAALSATCDHVIPTAMLERMISPDLIDKLTARIAVTELEVANLDLVRCPFCLYAEFKEPPPRIRLRFDYRTPVLLILYLLTLLFPFALASITFPLMICIEYTNFFEWKDLDTNINASYRRLHGRVQEGVRIFKCRNVKKCGRESCIQCHKEWTAFHDCLKNAADGLRLYVEKAMADAVKRTCPKCNIGFIKSDGCNLMHCRCGFVMCYTCRQDVKELGYHHFCQHFRPLGGACTTCSKCGLYDREDEEKAINEARLRATQEYLARHPTAINAVRISAYRSHTSRKEDMIIPQMIQARSMLGEIIDFIMMHGRDFFFETY